jgi:hypothetical protein
LCDLALYPTEFIELRANISLAHERLPDEEGGNPMRGKASDGSVIVKAAFAYHQVVCGDMLQQVQGRSHSRMKRMEVTIVDADNAAAALQRFLQFCCGMHFNEWCETEVLTQSCQVDELRDIERGGDQQDGICAIPARFIELIGVDDKILA